VRTRQDNSKKVDLSKKRLGDRRDCKSLGGMWEGSAANGVEEGRKDKTLERPPKLQGPGGPEGEFKICHELWRGRGGATSG